MLQLGWLRLRIQGSMPKSGMAEQSGFWGGHLEGALAGPHQLGEIRILKMSPN